MADTSRNPNPDVPVPPGGGSAERLREFLDAREVPPEEQDGKDEKKRSADPPVTPP